MNPEVIRGDAIKMKVLRDLIEQHKLDVTLDEIPKCLSNLVYRLDRSTIKIEAHVVLPIDDAVRMEVAFARANKLSDAIAKAKKYDELTSMLGDVMKTALQKS